MFGGTATNFYLYFSDEAQAAPVVHHLKRKGFLVESRASGDEEEWLVLATKTVNSFEILLIEGKLRSLARSNRGEYDGYDRAI
ncbi:ribonuclease E inhibitor RraB [Asticcacaulis sp.]|uniref:ribonuclease E inhibitor RraB n=1 Tax=Asticcacaulis sp. TaxID=1872648 RepID=UPI003F7B52AB